MSHSNENLSPFSLNSLQQLSGIQGIYGYQDELRVVAKGSRYWTAAWITPSEILPKPVHWNAAEYRVKPVVNCDVLHAVKEGDVINLGDQKFEILHLPGHSRGSIGILGHDDGGVLASGDTVQCVKHFSFIKK